MNRRVVITAFVSVSRREPTAAEARKDADAAAKIRALIQSELDKRATRLEIILNDDNATL